MCQEINKLISANIMAQIVDTLIQIHNQGDESEVWLIADGSQLRVNLDLWNESLLIITFKSFSNRIVLDRQGVVQFCNYPKLHQMLSSKCVEIK